jgi:hypothetical protein
LRPLEMRPCRLERGEEHLPVLVRSILTSESFVMTSAARMLLYHAFEMVYRGLATWKRMASRPRQILSLAATDRRDDLQLTRYPRATLRVVATETSTVLATSKVARRLTRHEQPAL